MPRNAGLFLTASGVSPCATCQAIAPRFRSIAETVPYGGFRSGSPCTVTVVPAASPAAAGAADAVAAGGGALGSGATPLTNAKSSGFGPGTIPITDGFLNE